MQAISPKVLCQSSYSLLKGPFVLIQPFWVLLQQWHQMWAQPFRVHFCSSLLLSPPAHTELPDHHSTETNHISIVRAWEHFIRLSNSFSFSDLLELELAERSWTQNPTGLLFPNPDPICMFYSLKSFNMSELDGLRWRSSFSTDKTMIKIQHYPRPGHLAWLFQEVILRDTTC